MLTTNNPTVLKGRPWSKSRLDTASRCALQFYWQVVNKSNRVWKVARGDGRVGKAAHYVLEHLISDSDPDINQLITQGAGKEGLTTPEALDLLLMRDGMQAFVKRFRAWSERFDVAPQDVFVEQQLALTRDGGATTYFAQEGKPAPFFRGVCDVVAYARSRSTLVIMDHKTGVPSSLDRFSSQLQVYALLGFAHYPVDKVLCAVHFLKDGTITFRQEPYHRSQFADLLLWLQQWVDTVETSLDKTSGQPEPSPSDFCQYCEFVGRCPAQRAASMFPAADGTPEVPAGNAEE